MVAVGSSMDLKVAGLCSTVSEADSSCICVRVREVDSGAGECAGPGVPSVFHGTGQKKATSTHHEKSLGMFLKSEAPCMRHRV